MGFTDQERDLIIHADHDDILLVQGRLVAVRGWLDEVTMTRGLVILPCEWFIECDRDATMLLPHPIGPVPACDRCGDPINAVYRTTPSV